MRSTLFPRFILKISPISIHLEMFGKSIIDTNLSTVQGKMDYH